MRAPHVRLLVGSAVAAAILVAGGVAVRGDAAAASERPRVVVVVEPGGCPAVETLDLCGGFRRAVRRTSVSGRVVAPTYRDSLPDFLGLVAQQYGVVVVFGFQYRRDLGAVMRRHPKTRFVVMDASRADIPHAPPNLQGVVLQTREAAFLAGWLAAKLELRRPGRDVVGIVGGFRIRGVTDFVHGFAAGARRAAPLVEVLIDYSNDFVDPAKCAALARRQIARGAGTVFNVAGGCGLGTMQAAADAAVWAVGVDSDQSLLGPHVLTSVVKSFEAGFVEVLRQVRSGRIRSGRDTVLTIRQGAAGLGRISPRVPRPLVRQLDRLRKQIVAGTVLVPGQVPGNKAK